MLSPWSLKPSAPLCGPPLGFQFNLIVTQPKGNNTSDLQKLKQEWLANHGTRLKDSMPTLKGTNLQKKQTESDKKISDRTISKKIKNTQENHQCNVSMDSCLKE